MVDAAATSTSPLVAESAMARKAVWRSAAGRWRRQWMRGHQHQARVQSSRAHQLGRQLLEGGERRRTCALAACNSGRASRLGSRDAGRRDRAQAPPARRGSARRTCLSNRAGRADSMVNANGRPAPSIVCAARTRGSRHTPATGLAVVDHSTIPRRAGPAIPITAGWAARLYPVEAECRWRRTFAAGT